MLSVSEVRNAPVQSAINAQPQDNAPNTNRPPCPPAPVHPTNPSISNVNNDATTAVQTRARRIPGRRVAASNSRCATGRNVIVGAP